MFGSVSDLILKASNPPFKVPTNAGPLSFNSLAGAVLAIIKIQREQARVSNLHLVPEINPDFDPEITGVDGDETFRMEEQHNARARDRITRRRIQPDDSSERLTDMLMAQAQVRSSRHTARSTQPRQAGEMWLDEAQLLGQQVGAPVEPPVWARATTGRAVGISEEVDTMLRYCDDIISSALRGQPTHGNTHATQLITFSRQLWNRVSKLQAAAIASKLRSIVNLSTDNQTFTSAQVTNLRKWQLIFILYQLFKHPHVINHVHQLRNEFLTEKEYWQSRLSRISTNETFSSTDARQVAVHNIANMINDLTYSIDQITHCIQSVGLQSVRELAGGICQNPRLTFVHSTLLDWMFGHASIETATKHVSAMIILSRLKERDTPESVLFNLRANNLPIRRNLLIPMIMAVRCRKYLPDAVRMSVTVDLSLDTIGFRLNHLGAFTGQVVQLALREMLVNIEPQVQSRIIDDMLRDMEVEMQRHNDSTIARYINP